MAISSPFRLVRVVVVVALLFVFWTVWTRRDLDVSSYFPAPLDMEAEEVESPQQSGDGISPSAKVPAADVTPEVEVVAPHNEAIIEQQAASGSKYRIGKLTASFGEPDPSYEDAIASHELHNKLHNYPHYILRQQMLSGLWSKHAWIMTILGQELSKPEGDRLHWIFWHDRDTIIMNPQIPLDIFLPPEDKFSHIHLLCTNDRHGLNNGVFLLRVSEWSFKFFAAALAFHEYNPNVVLKYTEQSAMEEAIKVPWRRKGVAFFPQRWFNGYVPIGTDADQRTVRIARPGSVLIHFASNRDQLRPERMAKWHAIADSRDSEWDKPVNETMYPQELAEYWERLDRGEDEETLIKDLGKRPWNKPAPKNRLSKRVHRAH